ncbi:rod shape-determining protein MreD [Oleisolibacter albus]|uniref:rod shape-determining protein MreD n=1 Tax=Oleisolibacter albus TaxID=2171757 RepID=UPI000DF2915C|nr:rod shape-determining protein MreD [Oleisolibacter albus]
MAVGVWHRLDQTARHLLPSASTVLLMLVGMVPMQLPGWSSVAPPLALMSIFYWAVHRPDLLRPSVVFLIGVLQDLLSGTPLGLTPLAFVLSYWLLLTQRRFFLGTSFLVLWYGFALVAFGAGAVQWAVFSLIAVDLLDARPVAMQALLATVLFPIPAALFQRLHRAYLS